MTKHKLIEHSVFLIFFICGFLFSQVILADKLTRDQKLDDLFAALADSTNEFEAKQIEQVIWNVWFISEDDEVDALMRQISAARQARDHQKAWELSNQVVELKPDYAEGWNQRATMEFMLGNYEKSLVDIVETLEREPRHFGALAGRAFIYLQQNRNREAIETINQALKIHPFLALRHMIPNIKKSEAL